ncbi:MAG: type III-A CRISPR-associated RAMP protein Csm3 [Bacteroidales bacterium]|nr:type III-A CRISPR-associated RAMP protein Csm3 [Bacteroidales bacterium]
MKLVKKIILTGQIEVITGLHIGGSSTIMNIGETDLNVIKSPKNGQPIIPGSSLKGKLRSLLAKINGYQSVDEDKEPLVSIFGSSKQDVVTRLIVRDSYLKNDDTIKEWEMENTYTEVKWENTIDRKTGTTMKGGLRQLERVPQGAMFGYEMVLDMYDLDVDAEKKYLEEIKKAMKLLEDDYLGGSGTRGYGKIKFHENEDVHKSVESYASN